jgi:nitrogen regulatory protein P-II 1
MIRVEAIISSDKLSLVLLALKKTGTGGITILDARGWGRARALDQGKDIDQDYLEKKSYLFTIIDDNLLDKVINAILDNASTGSVGDGKIFVDTIDMAVDIASKQKGIHAL